MTSECIDSIYEKTTNVSFEVILVDNASTDGSKEYFANDDRVNYIYSDENLGFGRANNLGYTHSQGKYIFLLNSDTLLLNNAIYEFYQYMETVPENVGCIGCFLDGQGESSDEFPSYRILINRALSFTFYELYRKFSKKLRIYYRDTDVGYVTGADLFIRRNVVEECGLFDPEFFMYYEETEMQHRFASKGYIRRIILTPKIIHLVGASYKWNNHSLRKVIIELKSRFLYMRKVFPNYKRHLISWMHLVMIPRTMVSRASKDEKKELIRLILKNL
jgi:hypothetical protein